MFRSRSIVAGAAACVLAVSASVCQQSVFATQVLGSNTNGNAGGGIFAPANALGAPLGPFDVHSLGIGGDLTLGFQSPIVDGPGADFLVAENPFFVANTFFATFAEVMFVEVSSDGVHFCRFPARYFGPATPPGSFGSVPVGAYQNLAGQHPSQAVPGGDPRDVVEAGGDAFDLADLAREPIVRVGLVKLHSITHVRLVDVPSGVPLDRLGTPILDAGAGSADVDAVTAIHQRATIDRRGPRVDLKINVDGTMVVRLEDPDGWQDIDPASLRAALYGVPVDFGSLLASMFVVQADALGVTLVQPVPLPPDQLFTISFSLKDLQGNRSGQSRARPTS